MQHLCRKVFPLQGHLPKRSRFTSSLQKKARSCRRQLRRRQFPCRLLQAFLLRQSRSPLLPPYCLHKPGCPSILALTRKTLHGQHQGWLDARRSGSAASFSIGLPNPMLTHGVLRPAIKNRRPFEGPPWGVISYTRLLSALVLAGEIEFLLGAHPRLHIPPPE